MYCTACGTQNIPTDRRCLRCGTSLIGDEVGGSAKFKSLTSSMDQQVYAGVGAFLGFFLTAGLLNTVFADFHLAGKEIYGSAIFASIIFGALGHYIAKRKY